MNQAQALEALAAAVERAAVLLERVDRREEEALQDMRLERSLRGPFRDLHKLTSERLLVAVPGVLAEFTQQVPGEYWALDGDTATVACPCGAEPGVVRGHALKCPAGEKEPDCNRWFLHAGMEVRVAHQLEPVQDDDQEPARS